MATRGMLTGDRYNPGEGGLEPTDPILPTDPATPDPDPDPSSDRTYTYVRDETDLPGGGTRNVWSATSVRTVTGHDGLRELYNSRREYSQIFGSVDDFISYMDEMYDLQQSNPEFMWWQTATESEFAEANGYPPEAAFEGLEAVAQREFDQAFGEYQNQTRQQQFVSMLSSEAYQALNETYGLNDLVRNGDGDYFAFNGGFPVEVYEVDDNLSAVDWGRLAMAVAGSFILGPQLAAAFSTTMSAVGASIASAAVTSTFSQLVATGEVDPTNLAMAMATAGFGSSLTEFLNANPDYFGQWGNMMAQATPDQQSIIQDAMNASATANFGYESYQDLIAAQEAGTFDPTGEGDEVVGEVGDDTDILDDDTIGDTTDDIDPDPDPDPDPGLGFAGTTPTTPTTPPTTPTGPAVPPWASGGTGVLVDFNVPEWWDPRNWQVYVPGVIDVLPESSMIIGTIGEIMTNPGAILGDVWDELSQIVDDPMAVLEELLSGVTVDEAGMITVGGMATVIGELFDQYGDGESSFTAPETTETTTDPTLPGGDDDDDDNGDDGETIVDQFEGELPAVEEDPKTRGTGDTEIGTIESPELPAQPPETTQPPGTTQPPETAQPTPDPFEGTFEGELPSNIPDTKFTGGGDTVVRELDPPSLIGGDRGFEGQLPGVTSDPKFTGGGDTVVGTLPPPELPAQTTPGAGEGTFEGELPSNVPDTKSTGGGDTVVRELDPPQTVVGGGTDIEEIGTDDDSLFEDIGSSGGGSGRKSSAGGNATGYMYRLGWNPNLPGPTPQGMMEIQTQAPKPSVPDLGKPSMVEGLFAKYYS